MPSAPGMCDGEMHLQVRNIDSSMTTDISAYSPFYNGSGLDYYNMCENTYQFGIWNSFGTKIFEITMNNDLELLPNCSHYDAMYTVNSPSNYSVCNGDITMEGSSIYPGMNYSFHLNVQSGGGATDLNWQNNSNQFLNGLCEGPYFLSMEAANSIYKTSVPFYITSDTSNSSNWNEPDSVLIDTDTIVLSALVNCAAIYNLGIDTVYISSITGIGNNQYEFGITLVSASDTFNLYANAITDTSGNYFIDITIFCEDSSRSMDPFISIRNLIYHGVKTTTSISERSPLKSLKLYPNPFDDRIIIDYDAKENASVDLIITDISGKIVFSSRTTSFYSGRNQLDLIIPEIALGLYFLKLDFDEGKYITRKILKN
jgi:hypothetical protein